MRIQEIRKRKGIKQKELAAKLGIAANTLSQYEAGSREPDIETTKKIARELDVSVDELVGKGNEKTPTESSERSFDENEIKVAFFRGADPASRTNSAIL